MGRQRDPKDLKVSAHMRRGKPPNPWVRKPKAFARNDLLSGHLIFYAADFSKLTAKLIGKFIKDATRARDNDDERGNWFTLDGIIISADNNGIPTERLDDDHNTERM